MSRVEILTLATPIPFTTNSLVREVAIASAPAYPATIGVFQDAYVATPHGFFAPQDHIKILSIAVRYPFCFTVGSGVCKLALGWRNRATPGAYQPIQTLGLFGVTVIALPDTEIEYGVYCPHAGAIYPAGGLLDAQLELISLRVNVSQVGVPTAIIPDGTVLGVDIALKIEHTEPLLV